MANPQITLDIARQALSFIPSDDRYIWVRMGMALKSEFIDAFDVFNGWSESAGSYDAKAVAATWRSFKRGGRVGIGSLLLEAKNNGFVLENKDYQTPCPHAIALRKKQREEQIALEQISRQQAAGNAVQYSQRLWSSASKIGQSPYLTKKQVTAECCRFLNATILVPMLDYATEPAAFVGVQSIKPDGTKLFPKDVAKSGSACRLGDYGCNVLMVCEGYATGLSLRMATNYLMPVFVAFDAGNLIKVVAMLRQKFPQHSLIVCADNDQKTRGNPGIKAAKKAIKHMPKADLIYPIFAMDDKKNSDFNDLHVCKGLAAVVRQLKPVCAHYGVLIGVNNG